MISNLRNSIKRLAEWWWWWVCVCNMHITSRMYKRSNRYLYRLCALNGVHEMKRLRLTHNSKIQSNDTKFSGERFNLLSNWRRLDESRSKKNLHLSTNELNNETKMRREKKIVEESLERRQTSNGETLFKAKNNTCRRRDAPFTTYYARTRIHRHNTHAHFLRGIFEQVEEEEEKTAKVVDLYEIKHKC